MVPAPKLTVLLGLLAALVAASLSSVDVTFKGGREGGESTSGRERERGRSANPHSNKPKFRPITVPHCSVYLLLVLLFLLTFFF